MSEPLQDLGIVTIGRNEGERLRRCLQSVAGRGAPVVYVDSGSTDDSVEMARSLGVEVVELDMSRPFNMARGRNAGFKRLLELRPDLIFVQFVDGDCEVIEGWLEKARRNIGGQPEAALVTGRRKERFRNQSIYTRLVDMEWDGHPGEVHVTGGDVLMRVEAYRSVNGYDETLMGSEDPEICIRLRQRGWKILRIDAEMTIHDIAMKRFSQWWKRTVRSGRDFAEVANRHRRLAEKPCRRQTFSNWSWGLAIPLLAIALAWPTRGLSLAAFAAGMLLWTLRIACRRRREFKDGWLDSLLFGAGCMLAKFPMMLGQIRYWRVQFSGQGGGLIEYK